MVRCHSWLHHRWNHRKDLLLLSHDYKIPTEDTTSLVSQSPPLHQSAMARTYRQSLTANGPSRKSNQLLEKGLCWLVSWTETPETVHLWGREMHRNKHKCQPIVVPHLVLNPYPKTVPWFLLAKKICMPHCVVSNLKDGASGPASIRSLLFSSLLLLWMGPTFVTNEIL